MDRRTLLLAAGTTAALAAAPHRVFAAPAGSGARFEGELILNAGHGPQYMRLMQPCAFVDAQGNRWAVPAGIEVDGASIPQPFWSIIGGPFEGAYRNASVIHDYFCDVRTEPWQKVHRMFYDGMIANQTDLTTAKIMYLAVYYGGPRWSEVVIRNMRVAQKAGASNKGGPEGVGDLGNLTRVETGLGMDIAVPAPPRAGSSGTGMQADYTIVAVERPVVDVYKFQELRDEVQRRNPSLDDIDALVEAKRLQS